MKNYAMRSAADGDEDDDDDFYCLVHGCTKSPNRRAVIPLMDGSARGGDR